MFTYSISAVDDILANI